MLVQVLGPWQIYFKLYVIFFRNMLPRLFKICSRKELRNLNTFIYFYVSKYMIWMKNDNMHCIVKKRNFYLRTQSAFQFRHTQTFLPLQYPPRLPRRIQCAAQALSLTPNPLNRSQVALRWRWCSGRGSTTSASPGVMSTKINIVFIINIFGICIIEFLPKLFTYS